MSSKPRLLGSLLPIVPDRGETYATNDDDHYAIAVFATADELAALKGMTDEQRLGLAAVCAERLTKRNEEYRAEMLADIDRQNRIAAYRALKAGEFPSRLVEAAVGTLVMRNISVHDVAAAESRDTPAMRHACEFVAGSKSSLLLLGGVGAGKTFAATWVAYRAGGNRPGYIRASELEARGRYDHDLRTWLKSRSMLVVDDLGVEPMDGKGYFRALLEEVIDGAWADQRRLVITSNLLPTKKQPTDHDQIVERYSTRIWSRLCDEGLVGGCGSTDLRRSP